MASLKLKSSDGAALPTRTAPRIDSSTINDDDPPPTPAAPGLRLRVPEQHEAEIDAALERLTGYNRLVLKRRNEEAQTDPSTLANLEADVVQLLDWKALSSALDPSMLGQGRGRELMKQLGFILGSLNRHFLVRASACADPSGEKQLTNFFAGAVGIALPELLSNVANAAKHPPYHSYATYWLNNPEGLSFTNDRGEQYFGTIVRSTNHIFAKAAELLRPLQVGNVPLDSAGAISLLSAALQEISVLHDAYNFLRKEADTGQRRLAPDFFMNVMRGYIAPVLLDGTKIEGPNATYSPGWPRVDFAIDNRPLFYVNTVQSRYLWMLPEHRTLLDQALDLPSFIDAFVVQSKLPRALLVSTPAEQLRLPIEQECAALMPALTAYGSFVEAFNNISGTHVSMIRKYLTKPSEKLTEIELARIVPRPDGGVGGNPISHTQAIFDMRRQHPINTKFIVLARQWSAAV